LKIYFTLIEMCRDPDPISGPGDEVLAVVGVRVVGGPVLCPLHHCRHPTPNLLLGERLVLPVLGIVDGDLAGASHRPQRGDRHLKLMKYQVSA
jgi:hypothetical protein